MASVRAAGRVGRVLVDADGVSLNPRSRDEVRKTLHLVLGVAEHVPADGLRRSGSCDPVKVTGAVIPVIERNRPELGREVEHARRSRMPDVPGHWDERRTHNAHSGVPPCLQACRSHDRGPGVYKMDRRGGRRRTGGRTDRRRMSTSTDPGRHEHGRGCGTEAVHLPRIVRSLGGHSRTLAQGAGHTPAVKHAVLDAGPIPHEHLERFDDADIETGLEQSGNSSEGATYRLVEIDVADLEDTRNFPFDWRPTDTIERSVPSNHTVSSMLSAWSADLSKIVLGPMSGGCVILPYGAEPPFGRRFW